MTRSVEQTRILTDLVWQRSIAILEDQAQTLIRTAFSTTTRESGDLSAGLFDGRSRMVAQAVTGTPGHVNSMALAVQHFLKVFPLSELTPGDVLLSNDPWICSGHLHDFTVVTAIFRNGRAVGAVANTIHVVDIGGSGFGAAARDVHEEGLCIPVCKLADAGAINPLLLEIVRANVREPDQVIGDLYASIAGNEGAVNRFEALMREFDLDDFDDIADAIIDRTQRTVERRIQALPDGVYRSDLELDGYDGAVRLKLAIRVEGSSLVLDFSGCSSASSRGVNVVLNYTKAYATFGVNCLLNPDIPCNHGSLAPLTVLAPEGCILNAVRPSAVSARHMIGQMLPDLVLTAFQDILPSPAEGAGLIWNPSIRGYATGGRAFSTVTFNAGGAGAQQDRDGWNATAFPSGVKTMPVEAIEASAPILIRRKELRPDSGGAGRFRGGLGQVIEIAADGEGALLFNAMFDRLEHPARGRFGGREGACGVVRSTSGKLLPGKGVLEIPSGQALVLELPGGGGYGPPEDREAAAIATDVREGYVTEGAAHRDYGWSRG